MKKIRNIVFDFGNVLLNLDMSATEKQMQALIGDAYGFSAAQNAYPVFFEDYEVGKISETDFFAGLQNMQPERTLEKDNLKAAWNAMLLDLPADRLRMLERLRRKYRVFLLSNTNKTHIDFVMDYLKKAHGVTSWDTRFFDKVYYSHLIKMRKPAPDIYNFVLRDANLKAPETLFIDDNAANIKTAANLGWQTVLHNDGRDIVEVMRNF